MVYVNLHKAVAKSASLLQKASGDSDIPANLAEESRAAWTKLVEALSKQGGSANFLAKANGDSDIPANLAEESRAAWSKLVEALSKQGGSVNFLAKASGLDSASE